VSVWYAVSDLERARDFYSERLGFEERFRDEEGRWMRLVRDRAEIVLVESSEPTGAVLAIDVDDVKAEAARLRDEGVEVGVVLEIHGMIRLVDVYDPDGNRLQLTQGL
jgi:catechol 2,3-dioxygenase-like lactoylglutathione lyase family enzyme